MDAPLGIVAHWILAILLVFASLKRCEAIPGWFKRPGDRINVVQNGVDNIDVKLEWVWDIDNGTLYDMVFERQRPGETTTSRIASRTFNSGFTVVDQYVNDYDVRLPAILTLKNVDNNEEYIYIIRLGYITNQYLGLYDQVAVVVYVPPKLTTVPNRRPVVDAGQNVTLTCNASGDPLPNITWTREGFAEAEFNASGYKLHLVDIRRRDIGGYRCTADNGYGTATSLSVLNIKCGSQCKLVMVGIRITGSAEWNDALGIHDSFEFKTMETNLTSVIASVYAACPEKQLYELAIVKFRPGSVVAIVQLQFHKYSIDPLKPLRDDIADGKLGAFIIEKHLDVNPSEPSSASTAEATSVPAVVKIWAISGGCVAVVLFSSHD